MVWGMVSIRTQTDRLVVRHLTTPLIASLNSGHQLKASRKLPHLFNISMSVCCVLQSTTHLGGTAVSREMKSRKWRCLKKHHAIPDVAPQVLVFVIFPALLSFLRPSADLFKDKATVYERLIFLTNCLKASRV